MRKIFKSVLLTAAMTALAVPASAATITYTLDDVFSGALVQGSVSVTLTDITGGVEASFNASNLTLATEFVTEWDLNLDPSFNQAYLDTLVFNYVSGIQADSVDATVNGYKADGDGDYDIGFVFPSANGSRLGIDGNTSVYNILGTGLDITDFNFLDFGGTKGDFFTAAHVQGIGTCSGWVGALGPNSSVTPFTPDTNCGTVSTTTTGTPNVTTTTGTPNVTSTGNIPEPTLLSLLGVGLAVASRRMRRKTA